MSCTDVLPRMFNCLSFTHKKGLPFTILSQNSRFSALVILSISNQFHRQPQAASKFCMRPAQRWVFPPSLRDFHCLAKSFKFILRTVQNGTNDKNAQDKIILAQSGQYGKVRKLLFCTWLAAQKYDTLPWVGLTSTNTGGGGGGKANRLLILSEADVNMSSFMRY